MRQGRPSQTQAMPLLAEALSQVPDAQTGQVLEELRLLAPGVAAAIEPVPAQS